MTGWTLDYIDTLDVEELNRIMGFYDGAAAGEKERAEMASKKKA